jgi:hypothetical protein
MWIARVLVTLSFALCIGTAQETTTYVAHYLEPFPGPEVYKDPHSGTTLYVETDGRHVAAISGDGKLLWNRDPYKDAHLPFYRTEKPQIVYIGPVAKSSRYAKGESNKFAAITFNNSQFGLLRISNGEFQFLGQD